MMTMANEILPRLWLGNIKASADTDFLQQHHINAVFNCTKDLPFASLPTRKYRLAVDDNLEDVEIRNMELWAPEAVLLAIDEYNKGGRILVHCFAGAQRSAAVVAMMLIVLKNIHADEAIAFVKSRRSVAFFPGVNFRRAIHAFDSYYHNTVLPHILAEKKNA
jgi:atypical dual specificity phosphatase